MSGSNSGEISIPANVSTSGDSCTWYAGESCEHSRSCADCLNVGVVGDTCAVGNYGQCVSTSSLLPGATYYLASTLSYCGSTDQTCTTCRYSWLEEYAKDGKVTSSPTCTGEGGCICIAVCERETRDSTVIHSECPAYETAKLGSILLVLAAGVATFFMFTVLTICLKRTLLHYGPCLQFHPPVQPRRPPRSPRGPQLSLSGWKSMREKLIETELGNEPPTAGPSGVMRVQLSTAEAMSVIIEEGEGFRPASPSEHQH